MGNIRAASIFFWLCLIFPTEERFRENPDTSLEENKNFTALLSWRERSSLSIHSNWRTQFYHSKNLAFLQIKGKKVNRAFVKIHGIKNYFPFEFWNVIFFRMTNCSNRHTSCIAEDSKGINQCFLKHFHTAIVLLHRSYIFPGSRFDLRRLVYCDAQIVQHL